MADRKEKEAYKQALDLVTALYRVNKNEVNEATAKWLESESEGGAASDEAAAPNHGKIYEGIFRAVQSVEERTQTLLFLLIVLRRS